MCGCHSHEIGLTFSGHIAGWRGPPEWRGEECVPRGCGRTRKAKQQRQSTRNSRPPPRRTHRLAFQLSGCTAARALHCPQHNARTGPRDGTKNKFLRRGKAATPCFPGLRSHGMRRGSGLQIMFLQQIMLFQFAIERRAADPELARHCRHLAAVMDEREFYRFGFQSIKVARMAVFVKEREDIGIAHLDADKLFRGLRLPRGDRRGGDANIETLDPRRDLRKLGDRQLAAVGERNGAKGGVFQLPHIARPIVGAEQGERLGADPANWLSFRGGESCAKPARETGDIVAPGYAVAGR